MIDKYQTDVGVSVQVPVHVFLDLSTLCCKHLSEPTELFVLDLMNSSANHTSQEVKVGGAENP